MGMLALTMSGSFFHLQTCTAASLPAWPVAGLCVTAAGFVMLAASLAAKQGNRKYSIE